MKTFLEWIGGEIFGWLSPSGRMHPCGRFGHTSLALNTPELRKALEEGTVEALERAEEIRRGLEAGSETGYTWDDYESMKEDAEADVSTDMIRAGFLRVGSWGSDTTFEGTPDAIKNLHQKAKDIAEERGGKAVFEPTRA